MEVVKKYTAIQMRFDTVNDNVNVSFQLGEITGPYYDRSKPIEIHDSEQEAIEWAHEENKWGRWLIVPVVTFDF